MAAALILPPNSKAIPLTRGEYAIVDEEDYEYLMQWSWCFDGRYAVRGQHLGMFNGKHKTQRIHMHRHIAQTPKGMHTDHISGDKLDNRKANLRSCTPSQNQGNSSKIKPASSKHKGVSWHKRANKWRVRIMVNRKELYIGCFVCEIEAAKAYDEAARMYFGEFSRINCKAVSETRAVFL